MSAQFAFHSLVFVPFCLFHVLLQLCYLSPYQGKDRGVLVQLGQYQLGHFPLGLWDEQRVNLPPQLQP